MHFPELTVVLVVQAVLVEMPRQVLLVLAETQVLAVLVVQAETVLQLAIHPMVRVAETRVRAQLVVLAETQVLAVSLVMVDMEATVVLQVQAV